MFNRKTATVPQISQLCSTPGKEWFDMMEAKSRFTPDLHKLQKYHYQNVFVYDEMMSGHHKHELVRQGISLGVAFTINGYTLWKKKLGKASWAVALDKEYTGTPKRMVRGEIYAVRRSTLLAIDNDKGNTVDFFRKRVHLFYPFYKVKDEGNPRYCLVKAWMYVGVPEYWEEEIDSGYRYSPVRSFVPRNPHLTDYYNFTPLEYDE